MTTLSICLLRKKHEYWKYIVQKARCIGELHYHIILIKLCPFMKQLRLTNPFPNIPSNLFNFLSMQTKSSMQQSAEILPEILKSCVNKIFLLMYF